MLAPEPHDPRTRRRRQRCTHRAVQVALLRQAVRAAVRAADLLDLPRPPLVRRERAVVGRAICRNDGTEQALRVHATQEQERGGGQTTHLPPVTLLLSAQVCAQETRGTAFKPNPGPGTRMRGSAESHSHATGSHSCAPEDDES